VEIRFVVGGIALACITVCGLTGTLASYEMMDKVNAKLPKEEQFEAWRGWYAGKTLRLHREYKRLYPEGRLLFRVRMLMAIMFACVAICAWCFRFFAK